MPSGLQVLPHSLQPRLPLAAQHPVLAAALLRLLGVALALLLLRPALSCLVSGLQSCFGSKKCLGLNLGPKASWLYEHGSSDVSWPHL